LLGVALEDGAIGETIDYATEGVFTLPKVSAAAITKGQQVLFDVSANSGAGAVDDDQATPATGDFLCGIAWETAGAGVTEIAVKINRPAPTVT
jgi:predicted RecA/RadA family phage recombinase